MEKIIDSYLKTCFPNANEWERIKLRNDWMKKEANARGLLKNFTKRIGDPSGKDVLELGFGNGMQLVVFVKEGGANMYGLEVGQFLYDTAKENLALNNVEAKIDLYDGYIFPYEDNKFDYIYATSVFEHVDDLSTTLEECHRVLKPGGKIYISFPNRIWPKETHMGLWFTSYLPIKLARFIAVNVLHRHSFDEWSLHFISYWTIKRLIRKSKLDLKVVYEVGSDNKLKMYLKKVMKFFGMHHSAILRTVMIVLEKEK